jgi:PAS domain S-box-containing protein
MSIDTPPTDIPAQQRKRIHTILIADDRYENRYFLQTLLEGNGFQVIHAENGQEALGILKTEKVDAIISDILMPLMDGFKLCRTIQEDPQIAHIPFIFYSASYTEPKDREFGLSLGAAEYISKPIEPEDLLKTLKILFDRIERGEKSVEEKNQPNNLSFYTTYADTLGRKLEAKVVESEKHKEAARFSENKYRVFLQNLQGIGYLIQAGEDIPLILAGQVKEITGYEATEFLSGKRKWLDIIHPEDREQYLYTKSRVESECGNNSSEQYRTIDKNGNIRWVQEIFSCILSPDPDIRLVQGAIYDVTPQKLAEEQIQISEEHYRTLFETMEEGVTYQDKNGYIFSANPSAERILGLTLDQLQGRTSMDPRWRSIHEDGSPFPGEDHPSMVSLRTGERNKQIMGVFNPLDERYHWILVNAVPQFRPGADTPYQAYTTFEDITEEKEARDHIEHLNRVLKAIRMVNLLITSETDKETLLNKVCSFLVDEGGYSGVWILSDSGTGRQVFQAISDPDIIRSQFDTDISQGNISSFTKDGIISDDEVITGPIPIKKLSGNSYSHHDTCGVMMTRLSSENAVYGMVCASMPIAYLPDPDEKSLFLEIARDIAFALHHITILQRENAARMNLIESEKQYRELVENISDTLFTLNTQGIVTYMSPSIGKIAGFDPSHYLGQNYLDLIHPDDRKEVSGLFLKILQNHAMPVEFRSIDPNGQVHYLRAKASPIRIQDTIAGISGILSDITAWKESENIKADHLKEIQALLYLHLLTEKTEDQIFTYALEKALEITRSQVGFIALVNEGGKRMDFHIWSLEVMKSCSVQGPPPHEVSSSSGLWGECITTKKPVIINDYPSRKEKSGYPDGHVPIVRFLEVPILDGDQVKAIIAVANREEPYTDSQAIGLNSLGNTLWEIIHRKQTDLEINMALTQITQNMEQLAALNDEIRNPLTIISLVSDIFEDEDHKKIMKAVHDIDDLVKRLDQGWLQSNKVRNFLIKHYLFKSDDFKDIAR